MPDLLTLAQARDAVRLPPADTTHDDKLLDTYIPAVTAVVEDVTGPIIASTGRTHTTNGGVTTILLPSAAAAVTSVVEDGVTLTPVTDYVVDLERGMIFRGAGTEACCIPFARGRLNVVVTYTAGTAAGTADVPANIKLAARIILRALFQAEEQGQRPQLGTSNSDTVTTPSGYSLPKRAYQLLRANPRMPGFA